VIYLQHESQFTPISKMNLRHNNHT